MNRLPDPQPVQVEEPGLRCRCCGWKFALGEVVLKSPEGNLYCAPAKRDYTCWTARSCYLNGVETERALRHPARIGYLVRVYQMNGWRLGTVMKVTPTRVRIEWLKANGTGWTGCWFRRVGEHIGLNLNYGSRLYGSQLDGGPDCYETDKKNRESSE